VVSVVIHVAARAATLAVQAFHDATIRTLACWPLHAAVPVGAALIVSRQHTLFVPILFIQLLGLEGYQAPTSGSVDDILRPFRERAVKMKFPDLLEEVNKGIEKPLEFATAYQSMQDARNCLEHRDGIVGRIDAKSNGKMVLQFPRIMMYVERNGERLEVDPNFQVEAGEWIHATMVLRKREYDIGQRLTLTASDFEEISFACSNFGSQLALNLPKKLPPATDGATQP
jgi:hypothetical protein